MKNRFYQKPCATKTIKRFLAVLLAGAMLFGLCACAESKPKEAEEVEPIMVEVEREPGPQALQTANEATALALRYYIYARLKTEELIAADYESMPDGAFESLMDELVAVWETADALATGAEKITDQAILLLETDSVNQTAATVQPLAQFTTLAAKRSDFSMIPLADNGGEVIDRQTWAENLSKQYDALRGAQRYKQLAEQLGTDTKTAVEQMALAQKIIRNAADLEEAQAEVNAYTRSINIVEGYKTASKVGLFVGATIATGGGSLTALAGSSMSVPVAGAVLVGGVDCVVDVGKTTSSIILGEDHQVTMDFEKAGDVIQPVSMVMGLVTMDPTSAVEQVAFLGEAMMEWCYPGKVTGIAVETTKKGNSLVLARLIELMGENIPDVEKTLEGLKLHFPKEEGVSLSELILANTVDSEVALEKMRELNAQISATSQEDENQSPPPQDPEPSDEDGGSLTGKQQEADTGPITAQEMVGTYSGSATLQHVEEDVEADDSLPVTLQLGENGTGTVDVYGFSGEAEYTGSAVNFSVKMKADGTAVYCSFKGKASRSGGGITISGTMRCSMRGVTFASYAWTAQK
jgi:predicted component of type VI protein secretion system